MCKEPKFGVWDELPAATTGTAPCDHAYSTPDEKPGPNATRAVASAPRLRLTTEAPWSTTQWMAAPTSLSVPDPWLPTARATTRWASGAIEATPIPLLVMAAMMPATWVPWPLGSLVPPGPQRAGLPFDPTQSAPSTTLPTRSSWPASTPVSTMPTVTPAPVDPAHAAGAPICSRPHCTGGLSQKKSLLGPAAWAPTTRNTDEVRTPNAAAPTSRRAVERRLTGWLCRQRRRALRPWRQRPQLLDGHGYREVVTLGAV